MATKRPNRELLGLLREKPVLATRDLLKVLGSYIGIKRRVDAGEIVPLGSGVYSSPHIDPFVASVIAASNLFSGTVISGLTALVIHKLSDERIDRIDVDIERTKNLRNRLLRVHRVTRSHMTGASTLRYHGHPIRIYDVERTLCEAYRIDPAGSVFFKALKRYLKDNEPRQEQIARYDKVLKTRVLFHLRQELASD